MSLGLGLSLGLKKQPAGGGGSFTPADLPASVLATWHRTEDVPTGAPASVWVDSSTNGVDMDIVGGGTNMTRVAGPNGMLAAETSDPSTDFYESPASTPWSATNSYAVLGVVSFTNTVSQKTVLGTTSEFLEWLFSGALRITDGGVSFLSSVQAQIVFHVVGIFMSPGNSLMHINGVLEDSDLVNNPAGFGFPPMNTMKGFNPSDTARSAELLHLVNPTIQQYTDTYNYLIAKSATGVPL